MIHAQYASCRAIDDKARAGKNLGFLEKDFRFFRFLKVFLDLSVQIRLDAKFPPRKNISLSFRAFSVKYNKTHKKD